MTAPPTGMYNGRYEPRERIARGGTAQVFLAHDLLLDRPVALKVLSSELSTDRAFVERFRREARAAANLTDPHIVSVYDWGENDETYFIVMEYVDGEPLSTIIRTQAPLDPHQAASIAADIARALSYAHRHGVVHRDVKPGNVLITADGRVKVTDFGIARALGSDDQVTQTGLVMGTATYFSPEQAQGHSVDGRSDVYALGVVLYEMLVGRPPFSGENPVSIAYQHVREVAPTPRSLNPDIPEPLEAIVMKAMSKNPESRYDSAEDLRVDLERFLRAQPVLAQNPEVAAGPLTEAVASTAALPKGAAVAGAAAGAPTERGPGTTTRWWLAAGAVLLIAIGCVVYFGGHALGYFGATTYFRVPDVVGEQSQSAVSKLTKAGLKPHIHRVTKANVQVGLVSGQNPSFPTKVAHGQTVTIDVIEAPTTAAVPSVTQLTQNAATTQLKGAGFNVKVMYTTANTTSLTQGQVVDQNPAAGVVAKKKSLVDITVIRGFASQNVPNLVGDSQAIAGSALANADLRVGTVTQVFSTTVGQGDVVSTSPGPGTSVKIGSAVDLAVSRGAGVAIPNLVGLLLAEAESQLVTDGFKATPMVQGVPTTDTSQIGVVTSQFPKVGKYVAPTYDHVILYVGEPETTSTTAPAGTSGTQTSSLRTLHARSTG